ncbi:BAG family molecular chaperone regulator 2 [Ananas comosus]|uniref:BAG family molecular chaperone regulator 2 n=1 Tax=Ananas comosus TaxID=4615 RepID=A0A199W5J3_ANACO|nr:BAG family molecular chaperone regulator 2 [Ananas comosus]
MIKLVRLRRLFIVRISNCKVNVGGGGGGRSRGEVEWELRPGGMLVQKRGVGGSRDGDDEVIRVRVSMGSQCHGISIGATSTFGELKQLLWLVTGLKPREQRLVYRGREREDGDHLHMVGVGDQDKLLLLEDPAIKEQKKLVGSTTPAQLLGINSTHCYPLLH